MADDHRAFRLARHPRPQQLGDFCLVVRRARPVAVTGCIYDRAVEAAAGHEEAGAADHRRMLLGGELYLALPEFDLPVDVLGRLHFNRDPLPARGNTEVESEAVVSRRPRKGFLQSPDTPLVSSRDAGSGNYMSFPYVRKWLLRGQA
ncbi:hypothetical protein [Streptomyces camelliae]|uniref:hypothetical protein n=1 Tax=Streptomyces camelliae TaxID=3004093 RepID=UPI002FD8239E